MIITAVTQVEDALKMWGGMEVNDATRQLLMAVDMALRGVMITVVMAARRVVIPMEAATEVRNGMMTTVTVVRSVMTPMEVAMEVRNAKKAVMAEATLVLNVKMTTITAALAMVVDALNMVDEMSLTIRTSMEGTLAMNRSMGLARQTLRSTEARSMARRMMTMTIVAVATAGSLVAITIQMMTRNMDSPAGTVVVVKNMVETMMTTDALEKVLTTQMTTIASTENIAKAAITMMTETKVMDNRAMDNPVILSLATGSQPLVIPQATWDPVTLLVLSA
jgi:hypothetical protein